MEFRKLAMPVFLLLLALPLCLGSCDREGAGKATSRMVTVDLAVSGMHCAACAQTIQTEISKLDGVESCTASFDEKDAVICFDESKLDVEKLKAEIKSLGYTVTGYAHEGTFEDSSTLD